MQQQLRKAPPPPKSLAIVVLMVGMLCLGLAGYVVWGWIAPDGAAAGRARLQDAVAAMEANRPNRAARLAGEAAVFFDDAFDEIGLLRARALEARALDAAGRGADVARALTAVRDLSRRLQPDIMTSQTLAELFFSRARHDLAADAAATAAGAMRDQGNRLMAAQFLVGFAGRLGAAGQPVLAARLYGAAIEDFMQLNRPFEAAQVYERIGIALAATDPAAAWAAFVEAINRFGLIGEQAHAEAVTRRVQQLPATFLETIDE